MENKAKPAYASGISIAVFIFEGAAGSRLSYRNLRDFVLVLEH
jgi:hypothetical protein